MLIPLEEGKVEEANNENEQDKTVQWIMPQEYNYVEQAYPEANVPGDWQNPVQDFVEYPVQDVIEPVQPEYYPVQEPG